VLAASSLCMRPCHTSNFSHPVALVAPQIVSELARLSGQQCGQTRTYRVDLFSAHLPPKMSAWGIAAYQYCSH